MFFFYIFPRTSPFSPAWVFQPSSGGPTASWKHRDIFPQFFRKLQIEKSQQKHPRKIDGWVPCPHGGLVQIMNSFLSTWVMEPVGEPAGTIFQGEIGGDRTFFATPNKMNPFNKKHTGFFGDFLCCFSGRKCLDLLWLTWNIKPKNTWAMKKWSLVR